MNDFTYKITQIVYIKTDREQCPRMVTGILIKSTNTLYEIVCGTDTSYHEEFELSATPDILLKTSN